MQDSGKSRFHILQTVITVLTSIVIIFNITCYVKDAFTYNLDTIPDGEFLYASMSPTGAYVLQVYYIPGSQTLQNGIRCELIETDVDSIRNIYWQTNTDTPLTSWTANTVININGISIDVTKPDVYDWRTAE